MHWIECPRDAIQGLKTFIPTEKKIKYLNKVLQAGFDTIDFGSFVSPKYIPQMADTARVLAGLDLTGTHSRLLAIVANERGARDACSFPEITYLGYPFSISETFQLKNTGATIAESLDTVKKIQALCVAHNKQLVIYISMGFGNPYGDIWNKEIVMQWTDTLRLLDIKICSLADTVGLASAEDIRYLFQHLIPACPDMTIGAHLHCTSDNWKEKLAAAWEGGCRRIDSAIAGFGGCPLSGSALVGNMNTAHVSSFLQERAIPAPVPAAFIPKLEQAFHEMIQPDA